MSFLANESFREFQRNKKYAFLINSTVAVTKITDNETHVRYKNSEQENRVNLCPNLIVSLVSFSLHFFSVTVKL